MQDASAVDVHWTANAQAWRVTFDERPQKGDREPIFVTEPRTVAATLQRVDVADLLGEPEANNPQSLDIVWFPQGRPEQPTAERALEGWVALGGHSLRSQTVRGGARGVRVCWRDTRASICASADQLPHALDAVVRFTLAAWETGQLERSMHATWKSMHADAPLTHAVTPIQLKHQQRVNDMTVLAAHMKEGLLRAETALEQLEPSLSEASKRLFSELVLTANLYDRLEMLEEPVYFAADHYELANTRLIESSFAAKEGKYALIGHLMEAAIIALLAGDLLLRMR